MLFPYNIKKSHINSKYKCLNTSVTISCFYHFNYLHEVGAENASTENMILKNSSHKSYLTRVKFSIGKSIVVGSEDSEGTFAVITIIITAK
jgi:hypothetical protein